MPRGGARAGAGRPRGSKDSRPRIRRADILNARREDWDRWEESTGALRKAREALLARIESGETKDSDLIKAVQLLEDRGLGRPTEEREQVVSQPLTIVMPNPDGGWTRVSGELPEPNVIEGEVVRG